MTWDAGSLLLVCLAIPLTGGLLAATIGAGSREDHPLWRNVRDGVNLATGAALLLTLLQLRRPVLTGERPSVTLWEMMPGLDITLTLEPLGLVFGILAAFLWVVTTLYAIGYMRDRQEARQTRFFLFFAIAISAAMGVALAGNLLTLFLFYEALTFSTYPLVTHSGKPEAVRSARTYLGVLVGTSTVFFLPAIIGVWQLAGRLDFTPGGLLAGQPASMYLSTILAFFVFGISKAALMPFHKWLPAAMVAPTPVSALLHAVAVVKAGVFSILKVVLFIFGRDLAQGLAVSQWLLLVACFTVLAASITAMRQDNIKRRLAYSTISQLSYFVVGALLMTRSSHLGSGLQMVMHAFGKITLFFGAGAILVASGRTRVSQLNGLGRAMPWTMGAFFIGVISLVGLPPTGGLWSKWYLLTGTLEAGQLGVMVVLIGSSLLNIWYLMEIPWRAFFASDLNSEESRSVHGEASWPCVAAQVATAAGCVGLFLFPDALFQLVRLAVE